MKHPVRGTCQAIAAVSGALLAGISHADAPPPEILPADTYHNYVRVDNELWKTRSTVATWGSPATQHFGVYRARSTDSGLTWTDTAFNQNSYLFDTGGGLNAFSTQLADGSVAFIQPRTVNSVTNLYYHRSNPTRTAWNDPEIAVDGTVNTIQEAWDIVQLGSGRIVVPFYGPQTPKSSYGGTGEFRTRVTYKDGNGAWQTSPTVLRSQVPSDWNGRDDGAVAAAMVQLDYTNTTNTNTNLWLLMRSQTGRFTQSFSSDGGQTWSLGADGLLENSKFYTSTGTPSMTRVLDADGNPTDRLVMIWCNATMPKRAFPENPTNTKIWYAGRDALHAAVSDDNGVTWKGFRELHLDPYRHLMPEAEDTGVSQAFVAPAPNGQIVGKFGQGRARATLRLDPDWLLQTDQYDDIAAPDPDTQSVPGWSLWTDYGNVGAGAVPAVKRARYLGTEVLDGASVGGTGHVLRIQKDDASREGSGAVWNFPSAMRGQTTVRVRLEPGSDGAYVAFTDRFFNPTDEQGHDKAYYRLAIDPGGALGGGGALAPGQWHELTIDFNLSGTANPGQKAVVRLDGQRVGLIDARTVDSDGQAIEPWPGLSYLRFRSRSTDTDTAGLLVDSVRHVGSKLRDAPRMTASQITTALDSGSGWTRVRIDDYVPNDNVSPTNLSGNGHIVTHNGVFRGLVDAANGVGVVIESSTGSVTFSDGTSAQITSDLAGPLPGQTLTLRFVDPADGVTPATVSEVAFRLGSVQSGLIDVQVFDADGNELPDWVFTGLPGGVSGTLGFNGLEDLGLASVIHEIRFTGINTDYWAIGSFNQPNVLWDFAYRGLTPVPEPGTLASALPVLALLARRRRRDTRR